MDYELIDSGDGRKLERFGKVVLDRPAQGAIWRPMLSKWPANGRFTREPAGRWEGKLPQEWWVTVGGVEMRLSGTDFGHVGLFPEHVAIWPWVSDQVGKGTLLNLFAYSGGLSIAAAKSGAKVCHVDSSKGMVAWARENAAQNGVDGIRWIVDDAMKFLAREVRRGRQYDGIVLDPPSFGRGAQGEVFKIEEEIQELLSLCMQLKPRVIFFSCHTPGYTPLVLHHLLAERVKGEVEYGEMVIPGKRVMPSGTYARWVKP